MRKCGKQYKSVDEMVYSIASPKFIGQWEKRERVIPIKEISRLLINRRKLLINEYIKENDQEALLMVDVVFEEVREALALRSRARKGMRWNTKSRKQNKA
jgi:predicted RNA-binding protein with EMAP domain